MRKLLISSILLLSSFNVFSQSGEKMDRDIKDITEKIKRDGEKLKRDMAESDSLRKASFKRMNMASDSIENERRMEINIRNLNEMSQQMQKRNESNKRWAYWRIGIGVVLASLAIARFTKKKKTSTETDIQNPIS
jgi:Skp family chaperone for outer membrane proteins